MKSIKKVALALVLMILVVSLVACSKPANQDNVGGDSGNMKDDIIVNNSEDDDYVMQLTYAGSLCVAPIQIAHELGFFEAEGLNYEIIKSETSNFDLMTAGKVDGFQGMLPAFIQKIDNGMELNIVSGVHTGCLKTIAPKDSPINSVTDLKGKKIGVPGLASSNTIILQRALLSHGIGATPENMEVEFVV